MADTSVKLSGTYDSIEAYNIMVEMQNMSADYEEIRTEAAAAASAATAAVATANAAVTNATTAANNASMYAGNANTSASDAAGYAANASTSATNAATSETNASNSATAAAGSATVAAGSATAAAASETAAAASAEEAAETLSSKAPLDSPAFTGSPTAPTKGVGDNSTKLATTAFVRSIVPAGVVLAYARGAVPTGWLLCDGSAVSRTDYAALYAVIGTTYGAGDGSTTFNLPNLIDKFVEGSATAGTVKRAGLPNITGHFIMELVNPSESAYGAFNLEKGSPNNRGNAGGTSLTWGKVYIDASRSSSIYGNSNTVQPPAVTMRYIIKY